MLCFKLIKARLCMLSDTGAAQSAVNLNHIIQVFQKFLFLHVTITAVYLYVALLSVIEPTTFG